MVMICGTSSGFYITNRISRFSQKDQTAPSVIFGIEGCNENRVQNLIFRICSINNVSDYEKPARAHFEFFRSKLKLEQINFLFVHQYTKFQIYFSFQCTKPCLTFQSIIVLSKSFETCLFFYCHPRALSNSFQAETVP